MRSLRESLEIDGETGKISEVSKETLDILKKAIREKVAKPHEERLLRQRRKAAETRNRPI